MVMGVRFNRPSDNNGANGISCSHNGIVQLWSADGVMVVQMEVLHVIATNLEELTAGDNNCSSSEQTITDKQQQLLQRYRITV